MVYLFVLYNRRIITLPYKIPKSDPVAVYLSQGCSFPMFVCMYTFTFEFERFKDH